MTRRQGIELQPLPADFESGPLIGRNLSIIPTARAFSSIRMAVKELLGVLVGR